MKIWIPNVGDYDMRAWKVDRKVREYDERLMFGRNETTGDWCIFIRLPAPSDPFPVLGFQDKIPDPQEALDRLKAADTMRYGDRIWREVVDSQAKYRAELEYKASQASSEAAEVVEHFMRQHGKSPIVKSTRKVKGVSKHDVDD